MVLEKQHDPEKAPTGRKGIDVSQEAECRFWSEKFGVRQDELKHAVIVAGPMPEDLARYLGKSAAVVTAAASELASTATAFEPGPLEKAQHAAGFIEAKAQEARRLAERTTDDVMKFIGARPVASVLIGAAVGYLLGWIAAGAVRQRLTERRTARALRPARLSKTTF